MENELLAGQTEDVVLGAMLAYPDKCLDFIRAAGLKEADFYKASNKTLFREIMKMADRGEAVELKAFSVSLNASLVILDKNNRDIWRKTEKAPEAD